MKNILCGRKLKVGDVEQIEKLKEMRLKSKMEEEREEKRQNGELNTYVVTISATAFQTIEVEALDDIDAENIASMKINVTTFDNFDYEIEGCREVKK